jgi:phosphoglycolate phosphatase-like HAD superfamily hydrolase
VHVRTQNSGLFARTPSSWWHCIAATPRTLQDWIDSRYTPGSSEWRRVAYIVRIVHGSTLCVQVLWSGDSVVPGAVDAIASLQRSGKRVFLVTNNSTKSKVEFAKKVSKLGFSG